jgi:hypothetical protein
MDSGAAVSHDGLPPTLSVDGAERAAFHTRMVG